MRLPRIVVLSLAALLAASCGKKPTYFSVEKPDPATKRTLSSGELVGGLGRYDSHVWLGIPFAAPPVGDLRWRAPRPPQPWTGTFEALKFGEACPQPAAMLGGSSDAAPGEPTGSEDCLKLNVFAPRFDADRVPTGKDRLPVMFWIHGGGNSIGQSAHYEAGRLATDQKVIVVTTQYRLGPIGWLRHKALRAEAADDVERSGNFGTLDLIRGLQWVRENVAGFGGDPDNVTIFGESAGGMDVFSLLLSPAAKGLFHKAISQSGGQTQTTVEEAENFSDDASPGLPNSSNEILARMLVTDGTAQDRAAARERIAAMSDADVARYLRGKSTGEILRAYQSPLAMGMIDVPMVFRDGAVVAKREGVEAIAAGEWNQVPVIFGTNRDEVRLFAFFDPKQIKRVLGIFPRFRDEPVYLARTEYQSRIWKAHGADLPAQAARKSGVADVFVYRFDWDEEPKVAGADLAKMLGAAHAFDLMFVFGHFELGKMTDYLFSPETEASRQELSAAMRAYWGGFAHSGKPGKGSRDGLAEWKAWDDSAPTSPKFMVLDTRAGGGLRMASEPETDERVLREIDTDSRLATQKEKCRLFHDLGGVLRGLGRERYEQASRGKCAEFAYEKYPWE